MEENAVKPLDPEGQLCLWPRDGMACRVKVRVVSR
jgi:hypothetical protein